MHFSQTTSFSCILGRAVKSTARVQLGLNHDYKPETLQQKHLQCGLFYDWSINTKVRDPQSLDFCDDFNCHFVLTAAFMLRCFVLIGESASNLPMKYIFKSI